MMERWGRRPKERQDPIPKELLLPICYHFLEFRGKLGSTQGTEPKDSWRPLPVWGFLNITLFLFTQVSLVRHSQTLEVAWWAIGGTVS